MAIKIKKITKEDRVRLTNFPTDGRPIGELTKTLIKMEVGEYIEVDKAKYNSLGSHIKTAKLNMIGEPIFIRRIHGGKIKIYRLL